MAQWTFQQETQNRKKRHRMGPKKFSLLGVILKPHSLRSLIFVFLCLCDTRGGGEWECKQNKLSFFNVSIQKPEKEYQ